MTGRLRTDLKGETEHEWADAQLVYHEASPIFGAKQYFLEGSGRVTIGDGHPSLERAHAALRSAGS